MILFAPKHQLRLIESQPTARSAHATASLPFCSPRKHLTFDSQYLLHRDWSSVFVPDGARGWFVVCFRCHAVGMVGRCNVLRARYDTHVLCVDASELMVVSSSAGRRFDSSGTYTLLQDECRHAGHGK